jgi:hypothetical protein
VLIHLDHVKVSECVDKLGRSLMNAKLDVHADTQLSSVLCLLFDHSKRGLKGSKAQMLKGSNMGKASWTAVAYRGSLYIVNNSFVMHLPENDLPRSAPLSFQRTPVQTVNHP